MEPADPLPQDEEQLGAVTDDEPTVVGAHDGVVTVDVQEPVEVLPISLGSTMGKDFALEPADPLPQDEEQPRAVTDDEPTVVGAHGGVATVVVQEPVEVLPTSLGSNVGEMYALAPEDPPPREEEQAEGLAGDNEPETIPVGDAAATSEQNGDAPDTPSEPLRTIDEGHQHSIELKDKLIELRDDDDFFCDTCGFWTNDDPVAGNWVTTEDEDGVIHIGWEGDPTELRTQMQEKYGNSYEDDSLESVLEDMIRRMIGSQGYWDQIIANRHVRWSGSLVPDDKQPDPDRPDTGSDNTAPPATPDEDTESGADTSPPPDEVEAAPERADEDASSRATAPQDSEDQDGAADDGGPDSTEQSTQGQEQSPGQEADPDAGPNDSADVAPSDADPIANAARMAFPVLYPMMFVPPDQKDEDPAMAPPPRNRGADGSGKGGKGGQPDPDVKDDDAKAKEEWSLDQLSKKDQLDFLNDEKRRRKPTTPHGRKRRDNIADAHDIGKARSALEQKEEDLTAKWQTLLEEYNTVQDDLTTARKENAGDVTINRLEGRLAGISARMDTVGQAISSARTQLEQRDGNRDNVDNKSRNGMTEPEQLLYDMQERLKDLKDGDIAEQEEEIRKLTDRLRKKYGGTYADWENISTPELMDRIKKLKKAIKAERKASRTVSRDNSRIVGPAAAGAGPMLANPPGDAPADGEPKGDVDSDDETGDEFDAPMSHVDNLDYGDEPTTDAVDEDDPPEDTSPPKSAIDQALEGVGNVINSFNDAADAARDAELLWLEGEFERQIEGLTHVEDQLWELKKKGDLNQSPPEDDTDGPVDSDGGTIDSDGDENEGDLKLLTDPSKLLDELDELLDELDEQNAKPPRSSLDVEKDTSRDVDNESPHTEEEDDRQSYRHLDYDNPDGYWGYDSDHDDPSDDHGSDTARTDTNSGYAPATPPPSDVPVSRTPTGGNTPQQPASGPGNVAQEDQRRQVDAQQAADDKPPQDEYRHLNSEMRLLALEYNVLEDVYPRTEEEDARMAEIILEQDKIHAQLTDLMMPSDTEQAEMANKDRIRHELISKINKYARYRAEYIVGEENALQDAKESFTGVGQYVLVGAQQQEETKKSTRQADWQKAFAQAKIEEIDRLMGHPKTTKVQKSILKDERNKTEELLSGAADQLSSNAWLTAAGYTIDAGLLLTGGPIIQGSRKFAAWGAKTLRAAGQRTVARRSVAVLNKNLSRPIANKAHQAAERVLGEEGAAAAGKTLDRAKNVLRMNVSKPVADKVRAGVQRVFGAEGAQATSGAGRRVATTGSQADTLLDSGADSRWIPDSDGNPLSNPDDWWPDDIDAVFESAPNKPPKVAPNADPYWVPDEGGNPLSNPDDWWPDSIDAILEPNPSSTQKLGMSATELYTPSEIPRPSTPKGPQPAAAPKVDSPSAPGAAGHQTSGQGPAASGDYRFDVDTPEGRAVFEEFVRRQSSGRPSQAGSTGSQVQPNGKGWTFGDPRLDDLPKRTGRSVDVDSYLSEAERAARATEAATEAMPAHSVDLNPKPQGGIETMPLPKAGPDVHPKTAGAHSPSVADGDLGRSSSAADTARMETNSNAHAPRRSASSGQSEIVPQLRRNMSPAAREKMDQAKAIADRLIRDNPELASQVDPAFESYMAVHAERQGSAAQLAAESLNYHGAKITPDQLSEAAGIPLSEARGELHRGWRALGPDKPPGWSNNVEHYGESDAQFLNRAARIGHEARAQQRVAAAPDTSAETLPLQGAAGSRPQGPSIEFPNGLRIEHPPQNGATRNPASDGSPGVGQERASTTIRRQDLVDQVLADMHTETSVR